MANTHIILTIQISIEESLDGLPVQSLGDAQMFARQWLLLDVLSNPLPLHFADILRSTISMGLTAD